MAAQRPRITLDLENRLFSDRRSALLRPITFIKSFAAISYQLISDRRIGIPRDGHAEKGEQKRRPTREKEMLPTSAEPAKSSMVVATGIETAALRAYP